MTKPSRKAVRRVNRLVRAVGAHAFVGAQHPDDRPAIEEEAVRAEASLLEFIAELESAARTG